MCSDQKESLAEEFVADPGTWVSEEHGLQKREPNQENAGNYLHKAYLIWRSTPKESTACHVVGQMLHVGKIQVHKNHATVNFRKMKKIVQEKNNTFSLPYNEHYFYSHNM